MRNTSVMAMGATLVCVGLGGCVFDTREGGPTTRAYENKVYSTPTGINTERAMFPMVYEPEVGAFTGGAWRAGDVFITSQPDEAAVKHLIEDEGVTLIVNLRTPSEMERMKHAEEGAFDEAAFVRPYTVEYGVEYFELPLGGEDNPPTPGQVDEFAEALARHEGRALLKCASGGRASHVWAAYLVRHKGFELNEALRHAEAMNYGPSTMEQLLGVEFEYEVKK